ncbi:MAG: sel1 repeat family protein [Proteobacteria bacterium]|nr:sel1 repeat family protein [Pseudomonadota bacterium]
MKRASITFPSQSPKMLKLILALIIVQFPISLFAQKYGDVPFSKELLKKAESGDAPAQLDLSFCYIKGNQVAADLEKGMKWLKSSALLNYAPAEYVLGTGYYYGTQGIEINKREAVEWFTKSANRGYAPSQVALGVAYLYGEGLAKNPAQAANYFKKAAEQGDAGGQNYLARCYLKGAGVEKNEKMAFDWLTKSAEQGLSSAQNNLGICYLQGIGVSKNEDEAEKWFSKAAAQGNKDAENTLLKMKANRDAQKILKEQESKTN